MVISLINYSKSIPVELSLTRPPPREMAVSMNIGMLRGSVYLPAELKLKPVVVILDRQLKRCSSAPRRLTFKFTATIVYQQFMNVGDKLQGLPRFVRSAPACTIYIPIVKFDNGKLNDD